MNKKIPFIPDKKIALNSRAIYRIPGQLMVKPKVDGNLEITVDLSISTKTRVERKKVTFRLHPSKKRADEFIFLPTEIVKSIGQTPADWADQGWD